MHFERSLKRAVYDPWKDQYIDYAKLKRLLRDNGSDDGTSEHEEDGWTEVDEGAFVEELVNVQLEKVHAFQTEKVQQLRERTTACELRLESLPKSENKDDEAKEEIKLADDSSSQETMSEVLNELDGITKEMNELEKYSRINYAGFLKATKKHDRKRGASYRIRPLMQVRLAALPFNKEDYSPLLFRLSTMYTFIREHLETVDKRQSMVESQAESQAGTDEYRSQKFWVHPDNILEVKTVILRRLPVLIYNPQTSKIADGGQRDPTITSIYFDNSKFALYNDKINNTKASSLRLRWYDQISQSPEVYCEKKTVLEGDNSQEWRVNLKTKYVQPFLKGDYKMDKDVQKLKDRYGDDSKQAADYQQTIDELQDFIKSNDLQPMLRANYTRTAFQIPGDNRTRITLDTNLALIREDALDPDRPCRDPENWHRKDIDDAEMDYPFDRVRKGEITRFPYALLEIRVKSEKNFEWVSELTSSHIVKAAPRYSKFVHGIAQLFDDYVNAFPFWLSEVETDIRKDPHQAFEEEQERKAKVAADEVAVGSLMKKGSPVSRLHRQSHVGSSKSASKLNRQSLVSESMKSASEYTRSGKVVWSTDGATQQAPVARNAGADITAEEADSDEDGPHSSDPRGFRSYLPSFSLSKYAKARRQGRVALPPGVNEPGYWLKDEGPNKVEAKVWLANQRTYIKWQHVSILLASLSLGLYNAAGEHNSIARGLAVVYTIIALFTAGWGYGIYMYRSKLIRERSGKDFDNVIGPAVVCVGLVVALLLNFGYKYRAMQEQGRSPGFNRTYASRYSEDL